MSASITRRDFLSGRARTGAALGTGHINADGTAYYPPAWTGLRGSHVGAFEAAHALAREHKKFPRYCADGRCEYDLIVVGAGISGLAAASFLSQKNPARGFCCSTITTTSAVTQNAMNLPPVRHI